MLTFPRNRSSRMWRVMAIWAPASAAIWILYVLLVAVIGGKNAVYGPGLLQWDYVRWMRAPYDRGGLHCGDATDIFLFLFFAVAYSTMAATFIFFMRTHRRSAYSIGRRRLYTVGGALIMMLFGLPFSFSGAKGLYFWWPTPRTAIPAPTVRLFEIATTVFWFASPFLVYRFTVLLLELRRKQRHTPPPDVSLPET